MDKLMSASIQADTSKREEDNCPAHKVWHDLVEEINSDPEKRKEFERSAERLKSVADDLMAGEKRIYHAYIMDEYDRDHSVTIISDAALLAEKDDFENQSKWHRSILSENNISENLIYMLGYTPATLSSQDFEERCINKEVKSLDFRTYKYAYIDRNFRREYLDEKLVHSSRISPANAVADVFQYMGMLHPEVWCKISQINEDNTRTDITEDILNRRYPSSVRLDVKRLWFADVDYTIPDDLEEKAKELKYIVEQVLECLYSYWNPEIDMGNPSLMLNPANTEGRVDTHNFQKKWQIYNMLKLWLNLKDGWYEDVDYIILPTSELDVNWAVSTSAIKVFVEDIASYIDMSNISKLEQYLGELKASDERLFLLDEIHRDIISLGEHGANVYTSLSIEETDML